MRHHRLLLIHVALLVVSSGCGVETGGSTPGEPISTTRDALAPTIPIGTPVACCAGDVITGTVVRCGIRVGKWCCDSNGGCSNCQAGHECFPPPKGR